MTIRGSKVTQWTAEETRRAAAMWQKHFADFYDDTDAVPFGAKNRVMKIIAQALVRDFASVYNRYQHYGASFASARHRGDHARAALAEMERRRGAEQGRSLTGLLLGDPPPGYSALDKKRSNEGKSHVQG